MTDHLHLVNQLAHHDAAISAFGSRMTAVESTLGHVQDKVSAIDNRMQTGFTAIESLIRENKAQQGPGLSEGIKMALAGGGLVSLAAGAVMFLVSAHLEPRMQAVEVTTKELKVEAMDDREARMRELEGLRDRRRDLIDQSILDLKASVERMKTDKAWNEITIKKGAAP